MKKGIAVVLIAALLFSGCGKALLLNGQAVQVDFRNFTGTGSAVDGAEKLPTNYYKASTDETCYSNGVWEYGAYTVTVLDERELNITKNGSSDSIVWAIKADFTGLSDENQNTAVTEFMNGAIGELTAKRTEFEAYLKTLYGISYISQYIQKAWHGAVKYTWYSAIQIKTTCINGYLSVAVLLCYIGKNGSEIYDCRTLILDLYTGKQVNFTDLFHKGSDIAEQLGLETDRSASVLTNFTLDEIIWPRIENEAIENTRFTFDIFLVNSQVGVLRDIKGLWKPDVAVRRAVLFESFNSFLYDGSDLNLGEKNFYALKADDYVTKYAADNINTAMENYINAVHEKQLMEYYEETGMTRNEIVLYFSPGLDDGLRSSLDDYLDDRNVTVVNLFGGEVKYNINIPTVLCGKCVIYTRAGAYFNGSIFEADNDYAFYLPLCLIFDIHTGEQIQLSQLYLDGWEQAANWYDVSASFNCYSRNGIGTNAPNISGLVLVDLRWGFSQYEKSTAIFMTKDGKTTYEAQIPNEYLNFN